MSKVRSYSPGTSSNMIYDIPESLVSCELRDELSPGNDFEIHSFFRGSDSELCNGTDKSWFNAKHEGNRFKGNFASDSQENPLHKENVKVNSDSNGELDILRLLGGTTLYPNSENRDVDYTEQKFYNMAPTVSNGCTDLFSLDSCKSALNEHCVIRRQEFISNTQSHDDETLADLLSSVNVSFGTVNRNEELEISPLSVKEFGCDSAAILNPSGDCKVEGTLHSSSSGIDLNLFLQTNVYYKLEDIPITKTDILHKQNADSQNSFECNILEDLLSSTEKCGVDNAVEPQAQFNVSADLNSCFSDLFETINEKCNPAICKDISSISSGSINAPEHGESNELSLAALAQSHFFSNTNDSSSDIFSGSSNISYEESNLSSNLAAKDTNELFPAFNPEICRNISSAIGNDLKTAAECEESGEISVTALAQSYFFSNPSEIKKSVEDSSSDITSQKSLDNFCRTTSEALYINNCKNHLLSDQKSKFDSDKSDLSTFLSSDSSSSSTSNSSSYEDSTSGYFSAKDDDELFADIDLTACVKGQSAKTVFDADKILTEESGINKVDFSPIKSKVSHCKYAGSPVNSNEVGVFCNTEMAVGKKKEATDSKESLFAKALSCKMCTNKTAYGKVLEIRNEMLKKYFRPVNFAHNQFPQPDKRIINQSNQCIFPAGRFIYPQTSSELL